MSARCKRHFDSHPECAGSAGAAQASERQQSGRRLEALGWRQPRCSRARL